MGWLLSILAWVGPLVLKALLPILRDESAKLYAQSKAIFLAASQHASLTVPSLPADASFDERLDLMRDRIKAAYLFALPKLAAQLGPDAASFSASAVITCLNMAYREVLGGAVPAATTTDLK